MIETKLLEDFKEQAYKNAVRLFRDGALLYSSGCYSSAVVLAIAAYEEIGKVHVIDRACDVICMNPEAARELYELYIKSSWTKDHKYKQRQALLDANGLTPDRAESIWQFVNSGGLEQMRQQALYVEMTGNKVQTPARITREKTFELIKQCHTAFHGTNDLAFNGFTAETTTKSEWLAARELREVDEALEACVAHNNRLQPTGYAGG